MGHEPTLTWDVGTTDRGLAYYASTPVLLPPATPSHNVMRRLMAGSWQGSSLFLEFILKDVESESVFGQGFRESSQPLMELEFLVNLQLL